MNGAARFSLEGRVALVTGAARGIGRAVAIELGAAGAAVALLGRSEASLEQALAACRAVGARATAVVADVGDERQVLAMLERVEANLGGVSVLVNNAGITSAGPLSTIEPDHWERMLHVNLTGTFYCTRAVASGMCQRGWGRIVNIASIAAQTGGVNGSAAYSASKAGMIGFTRTVARDLAPFGVTVNAIAPGQIDTAMSDALPPDRLQAVVAQIPLRRLGRPEEIAFSVRFLASEEAGYITGATLDVNGGILKR